MAEQSPAGSDRTAVDELLPLALSRPGEALARARAVLAARPRPHEASVAHQAAGIVLREFGDVEAGVRELRLAVRLAPARGEPSARPMCWPALGVGLVYAGRTAAGLAAFDRAVALSRACWRRGCCTGAACLWTLGARAALEDAQHAVAVLSRAGDKLWTARALNVRGLLYTATGLRRRGQTPTSSPPPAVRRDRPGA